MCSLCLCGELFSADAKDPYQVRVVVHVERHRLLTDVFQQQIRRELGDGMQAALGALARVQVTDTHPELLNIRTHGLVKALDGYRERSPLHTFFVLIGFSGSDYRIQTRMHDGLIGLPSPVVRSDRTRDRAYVARTAAFLMKRDFGLVGTVVTEPDPTSQVRIELKGGALGVDLGRWVKKGEVFRLVRVGAAGPGQVIESAYVQVVDPPRDGSCTGKLFSRRPLTRVSGLCAELLGTRSGPLRVRLLQQKPGGAGPLQAAVTLQLRKHAFDGEDNSRLQLPATSSRDIDTARYGDRGRFDRLAFVSVLSGETLRARVPVPVLDDSLTVLVVPASSEEGDLVTFRFRSFLQNVLQAELVQREMFREINVLTKDTARRKEALAKLRTTLERLREDHIALTTERDEVKKEIGKLDARDRPRPGDLQAIDRRLKEIKTGERELLQHVALLEKFEKEENDPKRKEWLIQSERAKLLEREGEVAQALAIYEKAPAEFQTDALKKHVEGLKKLWEPRDDRHRASRDFVYKELEKLSTEDLRTRLKEVQDHLGVLEKADDVLGITKFSKALDQQIKRIEKEFNELKPESNPDDDKPAQRIRELVPEIQKIDRAVRRYLEKKKAAAD